MKKKFIYEFEDVSKNNTVVNSPDDALEGKYKFEVNENGGVNLFADKHGYAYLAKLFIKLSEGDFLDGFHIHEPCDSKEIGEQPYKNGEISFFVNK